MQTLFLHYIELFRPAAYAAIFLGLILEGELVLFTALMLTHQGYLKIGELAPVILVGVFFGDYLWYRLGRYMADKPSRVSLLAAKASKVFGQSLTDNLLRILIVSKFTYGLHRPTLLSVGAHKVPSRVFFRADLIAAGFWLMAIGGAAWAASESLFLVKRYLKYTEIFVLAAVFLIYLTEWFVRRFAEKR
jgi:membrane protein DedA with SNARE-associated domain